MAHILILQVHMPESFSRSGNAGSKDNASLTYQILPKDSLKLLYQLILPPVCQRVSVATHLCQHLIVSDFYFCSFVNVKWQLIVICISLLVRLNTFHIFISHSSFFYRSQFIAFSVFLLSCLFLTDLWKFCIYSDC